MYTLLTNNVLIDKIVFRFNDKETPWFRMLFFSLQDHWSDIPFGNEAKKIFRIAHVPDEPFDPDEPGVTWRDLPYSRESGDPVLYTINEVPYDDGENSGSRGDWKSLPSDALEGTISKKGKRVDRDANVSFSYHNSYLVICPRLGRFKISGASIIFTVDNPSLLQAQVEGRLSDFIFEIHQKLRAVFDLDFFISEIDLAVDIGSNTDTMRFLREAVEERGHFIQKEAFARHKLTVPDNSQKTQRNGIYFGGRKSRFQANLYDRNVLKSNCGLNPDAERCLSKIYGLAGKKPPVILRTEFRLRNLYVSVRASNKGIGTTSSQKPVTSARALPTKQDMLHNRSFRRVYFDELDMNKIYSSLAHDLVIFKKDIMEHKVRKRKVSRRKFPKQEATQRYLKEVAKCPDKLNKMAHPFYIFLRRAVRAKVKSSRPPG